MVVYIEILMTDALIGGAGGMAAMPFSILESEIGELQTLVSDARNCTDGSSAQWIFKSATGSLIDVRLIVAITLISDEEDDGGEELERPRDDEDTEGTSSEDWESYEN